MISKKSLYIITLYILITSLLLNVYFIINTNKLKGKEVSNAEQSIALIDEKDKKIDELEMKLKIETSKNKNETKEIGTKKKDKEKSKNNKSNKELYNASKRFVEYVFNTDAETYSHRKKNAHNYMTDDLIDIVFASDGIAENEIGLNVKVNKIEVFLNEEQNEQKAIVYYNLTREITSINFEEDSDNYVKLTFINENGINKVSEIEAINIRGGV